VAITAALDPNLHAVMQATKPDPVTVTMLPPATTPADGKTDVTEPTPAYMTCTPMRLISPFLLSATSTTRKPAPRAGTTQLTELDESTEPADIDQVSLPVDAPNPQKTTPALLSPDPVRITEELPVTDTTEGVADEMLVAILLTMKPEVLKSWPLLDTSTVVLPVAPAIDLHSTIRSLTDNASTTTLPPNMHQGLVPSGIPVVRIERTLPPSRRLTVDSMPSTEISPSYLNIFPLPL